MRDVKIELNYNGFSKLFAELYSDETDRFEMELQTLTLEEYMNICLVASEFCYYIIDVQASNEKTILKFGSDEFDYGFYGDIDGYEGFDLF